MNNEPVPIETARRRRRARTLPQPPPRLAEVTMRDRRTLLIAAPYAIVAEQVSAAWANDGDVLLAVEGRSRPQKFAGRDISSVRERPRAAVGEPEATLAKAA